MSCKTTPSKLWLIAWSYSVILAVCLFQRSLSIFSFLILYEQVGFSSSRFDSQGFPRPRINWQVSLFPPSQFPPIYQIHFHFKVQFVAQSTAILVCAHCQPASRFLSLRFSSAEATLFCSGELRSGVIATVATNLLLPAEVCRTHSLPNIIPKGEPSLVRKRFKPGQCE